MNFPIMTLTSLKGEWTDIYPPEEKEKLEIKYRIPLKSFLNLWTGSLKEVYIRNGHAYLRWETTLKMWEKAFERRFERAINLLYDYRDELPEFYHRLREKLEEIAEEYFKERGGRCSKGQHLH